VATFAVTTFEISLFLHVTAVVVGLGATFAEAIAFPVAMRLSPRHLPYVHALQLAINRMLASPALIVIILTGLYQVDEGGYSFGDAWISATFAIVIALGALNGAYFVPTDKRLGVLVESEIAAAGDGEVTLSDEYQSAARTEGILGAVAGFLVVLAIFLMIAKPGA
jgi:uncharacterized membrane protein